MIVSHNNQPGKTRGKWEWEVGAAHQEAAMCRDNKWQRWGHKRQCCWRVKMKGGKGGATRGDVTICQRKRQRHIERVRGGGGTMRSNATTSWGK